MRPLGHHAKSVKANNLALARYLGTDKLLGFLGEYLPVVERESEDMHDKTRYLWQGTLEELALSKEITTDTLLKAWVLVGTPNKPTPSKEALAPEPRLVLVRDEVNVELELAKPEPVAQVQPVPIRPAADYDRFLDDTDADTTPPIQAKKTSDEPAEDDMDMEFDAWEMYQSIFDHPKKDWAYIGVFPHKIYGQVLALGQFHGKNNQEIQVYRGCKFNDDSFGKIGAITEFERKGMKDSTKKIKILKLRPGVVKFWVNIDDPSRPKGQRDVEELYRYFQVTKVGIREIDSVAYQALKNALQSPLPEDRPN
jgi:hypothetical protein